MASTPVTGSSIEMGPFVAIDFETADYSRDSACALRIVRVEGSRIVHRESVLIRPPRRSFVFSYLHGITWADVAARPTFGDLWPGLTPVLEGATFLVAHNASFDRSVLNACCAGAGVASPRIPFRCTMKLARELWAIRPTRLPDVCRALGITLACHHRALDDAEACAHILLSARQVASSSGNGSTPRTASPSEAGAPPGIA